MIWPFTRRFRVTVSTGVEFVTIQVDRETVLVSDRIRARSLDLMFAEARRRLDREIAKERRESGVKP